ncbi:efflux RND transporter periplasmic adaptor subunit [Piscirickettsia litoralis]|uniref:efflux RND transporter periplasmic adaptor subunit n=1 Tax=Piscirickettsia litoralis TaxID=1891921 RepID=UPI001F3D3B5C|nr:efflux RND transporter periplasmic adaptor subunit [Piscirickettsia litoralis]
MHEAVVRSTSYQPAIQTVGTLKAQQGVTLKTQVAGEVTNVAFKAGDNVSQGQLLLSLDSTNEKGQLDKAQADYNLSVLTYQRDQSLYKKNAISQQDLDQAEFTVKANLGLLEQAQSAYSKTQIKAPFSGKIGISDTTSGSYLSAGDTVVSLQNLDHLWVDFSVPSQDVLQAKLGEVIEVSTQTVPVQHVSGKVVAVEPQINSETGTLTLRAEVDNSNHLLLPGQLVSVKLHTSEPKQLLQIPETAVQYDSTGAYVYTINNQSQAIQTAVSLGSNTDDQIIVKSGLSLGQKIILNNVNLHNGAKVKVTQS